MRIREGYTTHEEGLNNWKTHEEAWMDTEIENRDSEMGKSSLFETENYSQEYGTLKFYSKYEMLQAIHAGKTAAVLLELDRLLRSVSKYDYVPEDLAICEDVDIDYLDNSLKSEDESQNIHILVSLVRTYIARNASHIFEEDI